MKKLEKMKYLNKILLDEMPQYKQQAEQFAQSYEDQSKLLRSLMNVRPPYPIRDDFLRVQDEYLKSEIVDRGIIDCSELTSIKTNQRIFLWRGDITTLKVDAIVNAANATLIGCFHPLHHCIDNLIHSLSGIQLRLYCHKIMEKQGHDEETGCAKLTPAFNLPSDFVIHTVGPIIRGKLTNKDKENLASCYRSCLNIAVENKIKSIAFCCISTGEFHFPNEAAARIATDTVKDFLSKDNTIERVIFNVFTDKDLTIYKSILV